MASIRDDHLPPLGFLFRRRPCSTDTSPSREERRPVLVYDVLSQNQLLVRGTSYTPLYWLRYLLSAEDVGLTRRRGAAAATKGVSHRTLFSARREMRCNRVVGWAPYLLSSLSNAVMLVVGGGPAEEKCDSSVLGWLYRAFPGDFDVARCCPPRRLTLAEFI
jgi:hypothetical protein